MKLTCLKLMLNGQKLLNVFVAIITFCDIVCALSPTLTSSTAPTYRQLKRTKSLAVNSTEFTPIIFRPNIAIIWIRLLHWSFRFIFRFLDFSSISECSQGSAVITWLPGDILFPPFTSYSSAPATANIQQ